MSSGSLNFYCNLCSKRFSGPASAQQHYVSEDHRKREMFAASEDKSIYDCDICSVKCNSRQQRNEHDVSPRHIERLRRQQQLSSSPAYKGVQSDQQQSNPSRSYDFDGCRGYCHVCEIDLTSPQHCRQHVSGSKHQKKEQQGKLQIGTDNADNGLFCKLCKVPFSGPNNAHQHYESLKHKKKEMESQSPCMQNTGSYSYQVPTTSDAGMQEIVPGLSLINVTSVPSNLPDPLIPCHNNINTSTFSQNQRAVDLTSPQVKEQHVTGFQQWSADTAGSSASEDYKCDVCNVTFSGPKPAEQHFASDKHKKRAALPHTNFSIPSKDLVTTGTKVQVHQVELFPTSLFPEEHSSSQDSRGISLPLNIPPESSGHIKDKRCLDTSDFCQVQMDGEICLKVDGGSIRPTVQTQTVNRLNTANNSISSETSYDQASSALRNMIADQKMNVDQDVGTSQPFTFSGDHGWCNICNIKLTSLIYAHDHLVSKEHRDKLSASSVSATFRSSENRKGYTFDGTRGYCFLCNIELTSPKHANQHLNGKSHTKAKLMSSSMNEVKSNDMSKSHGIANDKPEYDFHGDKGFCFLCNIELTSNSHAHEHLKGKNHKKAVERKQEQQHGITQHLFCEICYVKFSGPENAAQHFRSTKHIMKSQQSSGGIHGFNLAHSNSNAEFSNTLYSKPNINTNALTDLEETELLKPLFPYTESTMVTNMNCRQMQTQQFAFAESSGTSSNAVLSSLRPAPNNLSHIEGMHFSEGNHQSGMDDMTQSGSDNEDTGDVGTDSRSEQARRPQHNKALKNRNRQRQNKMTLHDDDGNVSDNDPGMDIQSKFDRMAISETNLDTVTAATADDLISFVSNCSELLDSNVDHDAAQHVPLAEVDTKYYNPRSTSNSTAEGVTANKSKPNPFCTFKFYCELCNRPMNTQDAYNSHVNGREHQLNVSNTRAPKRTLPAVVRVISEDEAMKMACDLVEQKPRNYQIELFVKTMQNDSVIFLPTGTGKTHVAAMTVSCMLKLNPRRPVLFLVDKVLLVIQQSKYLRNQFGDKLFNRAPHDDVNGPLTERKLKIATLSGGIAASDPTPLYQYDIIVAVAAYCSNLICQCKIYWSDFSMVVFDEAHHCVKKHPFNSLLREQHIMVDPATRPKILGLTASPAGKESIQATHEMLRELLGNLGNVQVQIVEAELTKADLSQYQSNAKLHIKYEPRTDEEESFRERLLEYLVNCYLTLDRISNIDKECYLMTFFKPKLVRGTPEEQLTKCAMELNDPDRIKMFMHALGMLKPKGDDPCTKANLDFLCNHTLIILMSLQDMDGMGIPCCMEELRQLLNPKESDNFEKAKTLGLRCDNLRESVREWQESAMVSSEFEADGQRMSLVKQLLLSLKNREYINWQNSSKPIALVLVRERVLALRLSKFLQGMSFVKDQGLRVTAVVGHGGGTANYGMRVKEQKRVLDGVKERKYQIVVATSVAEEGVDIPECELVICMNLPGTVTGFVQMRGRARKKGSHFVIICSNQKEEEQMRNLLLREKNMMAAAQICVGEQRRKESNACS